MAFSAVWYGPIWGKKWMEICGVSPEDEQARKDMQKGALPLYGVQFVMTLFQIWVLYLYLVHADDEMSMISNALWIWAAFIIPTLGAASMWTTDSPKVKWARFLIQGGGYLVTFVVFALIIKNFG